MRYMISLSEKIVKQLDDIAEKTGNTRSGIIHTALLEFLERYSNFFGYDLKDKKNKGR